MILLILARLFKKAFALARIGDLHGLKVLAEQNPSLLSQRQRGETLLHAAAAYGQLEVCEYLLGQGMDVDAEVENEGGTALMMAAAGGNAEVAELLINANANINKQDINGVSALHYAVSANSLGCVNLLLSKDVDVMLKDKIGRTAKDAAHEFGYLDLAASIDQRTQQK